jgi:hypothetical protein
MKLATEGMVPNCKIKSLPTLSCPLLPAAPVPTAPGIPVDMVPVLVKTPDPLPAICGTPVDDQHPPPPPPLHPPNVVPLSGVPPFIIGFKAVKKAPPTIEEFCPVGVLPV